MSDPHGHGGGSSGVNINPRALAIGAFLFVVFVIYFYFNPDYASTFIYILNIVQVICFIIILLMGYKLWYFMKEFSKTGGEIVHNYESKLKHHHEHVDENASLKSKYTLAMEHLHSKNKDEWKIGLIELDNFIRFALIEKGYNGSTTIELVKEAKEKGHESITKAEDIAYLRQRLKTKGNEFDFTQKDLEKVLEHFDDFKKTVLPEDEHSHHHDEHHNKH